MKMVYAGIRVTDLDRSFEFYKRALGLDEVTRGDMTGHGRGLWVLLRDRETGQRPELKWYPKASEFDQPSQRRPREAMLDILSTPSSTPVLGTVTNAATLGQ
jgi:catechol 2,3-dioxygenase-like lactoylglutathione lyase family enzyme